MKKLLFLTVIFFCLSQLWSQEVTQKNIQGKWMLVNYITASANLNVTTGKATVDKSVLSFGQETAERLKSDMESYSEMLKTAYVEIEGNNFLQLVGDSVKAGTFTIEKTNNGTMLNGKFDDGSTGFIRIALQDGKLSLYFPAQNKQYVYKKA